MFCLQIGEPIKHSLTWTQWFTGTREMCDIIHLELRVDWVIICQLDHLLESIVNEDEANKGGEAFFGEACEVLDQEAGISSNKNETLEG